jgi:hypothetical protein
MRKGGYPAAAWDIVTNECDAAQNSGFYNTVPNRTLNTKISLQFIQITFLKISINGQIVPDITKYKIVPGWHSLRPLPYLTARTAL